MHVEIPPGGKFTIKAYDKLMICLVRKLKLPCRKPTAELGPGWWTQQLGRRYRCSSSTLFENTGFVFRINNFASRWGPGREAGMHTGQTNRSTLDINKKTKQKKRHSLDVRLQRREVQSIMGSPQPSFIDIPTNEINAAICVKHACMCVLDKPEKNDCVFE